jgi:hypothetical protein
MRERERQLTSLILIIYYLFLGGILSLNQAKEGIYQCIGRNAYGTAQASTVLILPNDTKIEGKYR